MLILAIEKQKEALIQTEGRGTKTEKELLTLQKWAKTVKTSTADKEADKVLKAANLTIL